jgi:hypothetical protein
MNPTSMLAFLKPIRLKLVFLAEWAILLSILLMRGQLDTPRQLFVAGCPLLVFNLTACGLTALSDRAALDTLDCGNRPGCVRSSRQDGRRSPNRVSGIQPGYP